MVDIYEYSLTPKYEHIVKGFTKYKNYDENKPHFNIVRIFRSVEIELSTYTPLEELVFEINEQGESIWKELKNRYHCYYFTNLKGYCGIDFSYDMPEDVREKLKENPNYDLEELGWYNNYDYYCWNEETEPEPEDPEEKFYDDVWTYTPFSITFIKHKPPPLPPPISPPPPPIVPYEYAPTEPLEEISWDNIHF